MDAFMIVRVYSGTYVLAPIISNIKGDVMCRGTSAQCIEWCKLCHIKYKRESEM